MAEIPIRHVYSAFVAHSRRSVALQMLPPIRDVHDVRQFQAVLHINDLSHSYISTVVMPYQAYCYGMYISPAANVIQSWYRSIAR